jgi:hypothetical protein
MDEQLILDTATAAAPALRALATEILQAEAARLGVSLDAADVLVRQAGGVPAVHLTAAAEMRLNIFRTLPGSGNHWRISLTAPPLAVDRGAQR